MRHSHLRGESAISMRVAEAPTPCCHSRRPKAAFDFTLKADSGLIGWTRPPLQRSENAESSYFRHSPKRSTRDSDSANRRSHIADPWPPIEVSAALTRQRLEPEWVTSAILPSPTQARTSWTAACAPALTDGCRPNTNACQDLYRSSHPRSSGSTHPWYS